MKTVATFLALACVVLTAHAAFSPTKPVWPTQFSSHFGMYYEYPSLSIRVHNASSYLYYDWNIQSQTIDYQQHCIPHLAPDSNKYPCKLFFNTTGIYLNQPKNGLDCCQVAAGVGPVPPQFLQGFTYKNNETAPDYYGDIHQCYHWTGPGFFGYWTDNTTGHDIEFKDGPTGVYWQFAPFVVGPQSPSLFQAPALASCSTPCKSSQSAVAHALSLRASFLSRSGLAL